MKLTAQLLRDAADLLKGRSCDDAEYDTYMCVALYSAAEQSGGPLDCPEDAVWAFEELLDSHDVSVTGSLEHPVVFPDGPSNAGLSYAQKQELRFDFLNLLACSLGR